MIELKNISKKYGDFNAVKNIDLKINKGEVFGFLGPNGAGKTTTLKMITGILKSTSGDILINGFDTTKNSIEAKNQFGFVPDSPDIFLKLTGIEYLNFIADIYNVNKEDREKIIEELTEQFEMKSALNDKIQSYSHGMRQKIVITGVLLHKPPLWILDEPMTGLDPKSAHILKIMMREHVDEGNTVLFSTHVLEVAEKICDRVAIINKGEILFCGNLNEMKMQFQEDSSLEKMFLEITENE